MPTFTQIGTAQVAGSGGAASLTFTSIPSTYTDLILYTSLRINGAPAAWTIARCKLQVNSITTGYTNRLLYSGGGGSPASDVGTDQITFFYCNASDSTSNTFSNASIYIPNYAGSTNKTFSVDSVAESNGATQGILSINAGLLTNTAAITSLTVTQADAYNFVQHSTAYLYGVSNA